MSGRAQIAFFTFAFVAMTLGSAVAGERTHTVAAGESSSAIAKKYYGDFDLASLLLAYNGRQSTVLQAGDTLRIPFCEIHRVKRGDSWTVLSRRYLKNASNYAVVAELNGMLPEKPLQPGDEIVFPVFLDHALQRGETLAQLAQRYYGQPRLGSLLQESNRLDDPRRLSVGETVRVPLLDFRLVAEPKPVVARVEKPTPATSPAVKERRVEPPREPAARFAGEIKTARDWFRVGEFERSRDLLESIQQDVVAGSPSSERSEHARLLAFVYVAFDLSDEACEAYGSIAPQTSLRELDANMVSPRIRRILSGCASE